MQILFMTLKASISCIYLNRYSTAINTDIQTMHEFYT
uniref:Uncharacterized protein n=1 Tax=Rhizophora mucronata TaxID=61149 RepID=A0A2P2QEN0_RHIMU